MVYRKRQAAGDSGPKIDHLLQPQCPYIHQSVELVRKTCQEMRAPYTLILVDTLEKAKTLPGAFNNWAVFYQGKFVTVNLLDAAALKRFLKKGGNGVSAK
ncbi:YoaP domain-containing protein [Anaerotruncus colihominis]|uniref:YoaP domain-containing protein n=1 Tax=Anaerotruncus colihominis TaxID=169435 RepID=UPI003C6C12DD